MLSERYYTALAVPRLSDSQSSSANPGSHSLLVLDALMYVPDVLFYGARPAEIRYPGPPKPSPAAAWAEGVGEAAGAVFQAIVETIAGLSNECGSTALCNGMHPLPSERSRIGAFIG